MNSIQLTEEHKSKLLEMCKNLFPEKEILFEEEVNIDGLNFNGVLFISQKLPKYTFSNIHWFEFCTKIAHNIFSRKQYYYQSEEFITFMKIMCLQNKTKLQHPVDYLYKQFKKLTS